jgi:hypothetical protein
MEEKHTENKKNTEETPSVDQTWLQTRATRCGKANIHFQNWAMEKS